LTPQISGKTEHVAEPVEYVEWNEHFSNPKIRPDDVKIMAMGEQSVFALLDNHGDRDCINCLVDLIV